MLIRIVAVGIVLAACVVVLGAYTRLVDAGLGCPDWPGCYGFIGVPETEEEIGRAQALFPDSPVEADKAWPEMVHRYFATSLGALCLAILAVAWRRKQALRIPVALVILVIVQGAFGAWTVTLKLWPQVVTTHLLGGFATLGLLFWYWLRLRGAAAAPGINRVGDLRRLATASMAVVILQVALGGWVTSNYAALACPDFPLCHGAIVPPMDIVKGMDVFQAVGPNYLGGRLSSEARVAIQIAHRLGAVLVLVVVGWLVYRLRSLVLGRVLGALLALQWALGISNVVFELPLTVAVLHNAGGAALLLGVIAANFVIFEATARALNALRETANPAAVES